MTKAKNDKWLICKEVVAIDRSLPKSYGGLKYVVVQTYTGTERQAIRYAQSLEKSDPEVKHYDFGDVTPDKHNRIEYLACARQWIEEVIEEGIFKVEGYNSDIKEESLNDMSKEELIALIIQSQKDLK